MIASFKGVDVHGTQIKAFATMISEELGISCSSLSGANIANEGISRIPLLYTGH
jgi:glycerol-3-phosphate dehydrogenase (NAD+)